MAEITKYSFEQEIHGTTVRVELPDYKIKEISESEGKDFKQFLKDTNAKAVGHIYEDPFPKGAEPFTVHNLSIHTNGTSFSSNYNEKAIKDYTYNMNLIPCGEFEAVPAMKQPRQPCSLRASLGAQSPLTASCRIRCRRQAYRIVRQTLWCVHSADGRQIFREHLCFRPGTRSNSSLGKWGGFVASNDWLR